MSEDESPSQEEIEYCVCGKKLEECEDSYIHMTKGY
jgi:hypothetical protein